MKQRVAFLDRDGTINVDLGYVHQIEKWKWTDRAIDAIRLLNRNGFRVAVVTNQSAVAAGRCQLSDVERLHGQIQEELLARGAQIDSFAVCPHHERDCCHCRKPLTGLAQKIAESLGIVIDYGRCWTIGDKFSDIEFGRSLGTRTALVRSMYWMDVEPPFMPDLIGDSLFDCVTQFLHPSSPDC